MNFLQAFRYTEYVLLSRHRKGRGIHSPFVFNLVNKVFRNKTDKNVVLTIEKLRKKNLADTRTIEVTDMGAGSVKMKTNTRKVSDIAKYSAIPTKYGILLSNLARVYGRPSVIELGTSLGISTMYLASGCLGSVVSSIEGSAETCSVAEENFKAGGFNNIALLNGSFDEMLQVLIQKNIKPGLVFIDGDHRKEAVCRYFGVIRDMSDDQVVIVLDDIHSSRSMEEAWNEISGETCVSVSLDIYRFGILFLKKGTIPQSYTIRY